jgi:OmcA/MtrC family decaheme c-type cytochrome
MHKSVWNSWVIRISLILAFVAGSLALVSAPGPEYSIYEKARYADANLVAYVRPGLVLQILSASIATDGTIKVQFKITDPKGLPLDRDGVYTPGAVSTSFIAAYIPKGQTQYVAYTTRTQGPSPITGKTAIQAGTDSGGTYEKVSDGVYNYTFRTKAPAGFDATATHTIGLYGNRDLSEFNLGVNLADTTFNFVPNGSSVTVTRDVIRTVSCNKCHQDLTAHGETGRKSVQLCVLCHQPQTVDPDTGNTVDMPVMIHKIHMGSSLPSVQAGKPYQIIGFAQTVADYSKVVFPADARNCTFCHEQNTGASQATAYLKPNMAACGACHDDVDFATGKNHASLPQISNNLCGNCHIPEGELEFDLSIKGAHTIPTFSQSLPGTTFQLVKVDDGVAGKRPTVTFTLRDKQGNPILPSSMASLRLYLASPTSDYQTYVTEDVRKAQGTTDGTYYWTFQNPIPADAKGTYAVGIEGYRNITLLPGTEKEQTVRDAGVNKVIYFSVDGSPVQPRRTVVALNIPATGGGPVRGCNACHSFLSVHGGNRNAPEMCAICHNPTATDVARRPASEQPPQGINFALMIHKIHTGEELAADYTVYGYGGSKNTFNDVLYPGDRRRCDWCHVNDSQQLPLSSKLQLVTDPRGLLNPVGPTTSACTACHGTVYAASHALSNTTVLGEACAACHNPNADASVNRVHAK